MVNTPKLDAEYKRLVPQSGKCDTLRGEVVRAASKIIYRHYNDGDKVGAGYGHQTCDAPARFLIAKLSGNPKFGFTKILDNLVSGTYGLSGARYEKLIERIETRMDKYVDTIPETPNTEDMLDY